MIHALTAPQLHDFLTQHPDTILLDVREESEVAICQIGDSVHIPMNLVPLRQSELPDGVPIVVYCHHGIRSLHVAHFLEHAGFEDVYNLSGGIDAWAEKVDSKMTRY